LVGLGVAPRGRRIARCGAAPRGASGEEQPGGRRAPQRQRRPTALPVRGCAAGVYLPFAV